MKKYKCGLYVGRFQPLHLGHYSVIMRMLKKCDKAIIAIGSAQECGTERNPFSYALRANMIYTILQQSYGNIEDKVLIVPIDDRKNPSNDASWGTYLMNQVIKYTGIQPDVIFEGEEQERNNWYDDLNITVNKVSRTTINISGTRVRNFLLTDHKHAFQFNTPKPMWDMYNILREEILKCKD